MKLISSRPRVSLRYHLLDACARRLASPKVGSRALIVYPPGHLRDVLHVVPMLKALRKGNPQVKIIWLVRPWSEPLAHRYEGLVDEIRIFGPNLPPYTRGKREWCQSAWHQWRMAMVMRQEGVEILIAVADGPPRLRSKVQTTLQPYEKDRFEADAWTGALQDIGIEACGRAREEVRNTLGSRALREALISLGEAS